MTPDELLADDLLRTIAQANRWATMRARFEIPQAQARLLSLIESLEPVRITELAVADHATQPGTTAQVNKLVDAGLVRRLVDEHDARATPVSTSEAGRALLERTRRSRAEVLAPALQGLSADERQELTRGLEVLAQLVGATPHEKEAQSI